MGNNQAKYSVGNHTHKGMVRKVNQDSFGTIKTGWGDLYVVADGMGGHKGGETASKLTVDYLCNAFKKEKTESPENFLCDTLLMADAAVRKKAEEDSSLKGMGTTAVAVIIKDDMAYYAHVGDSRIYLFQHSKGHQLTKDHSYVQQLVDEGIIKPEEAESHPEKNKILQAIGVGNVTPASSRIKLYKDDVLLLCSDGLSGEVNADEMWSFIDHSTPMDSCKDLVNLANKRGGPDNSTVIIIKIDKGSKAPKGAFRSRGESDNKKDNLSNRNLIALGGLVFLSALILFFVTKIKPPPPPPPIIVSDSTAVVVPDPNDSDSTDAVVDSSKVDTSSSVQDTTVKKTTGAASVTKPKTAVKPKTNSK